MWMDCIVMGVNRRCGGKEHRRLPKQPFQPLACALSSSLAFPLLEHTAEKRKAFILRWQDKGFIERVIRQCSAFLFYVNFRKNHKEHFLCHFHLLTKYNGRD